MLDLIEPTFVNLSPILLPIKLPVAFKVFCTTLFDVVFKESVPVLVATSISFLPCFSPNFREYDQNHNL